MPVASSQTIDWSLLGRALDFYKALGYKYIEVPWLVRNEVTEVTRHEGAENFGVPAGDLVGSAEQSFIQMMMDGQLPPGRYCTISPCFRDEPVLDDLHQKHFMKLELIDTPNTARYWAYRDGKRKGKNKGVDPSTSAEGTVGKMQGDAMFFLRDELRLMGLQSRDWFDTEDQVDDKDPRNFQTDLISFEGWMELGSYGIRHHGDYTWVYGTGCAEPRWSYWLRKTANEEQP
jgi:hypothetical protein